jgi:uncharacterized membrane protein
MAGELINLYDLFVNNVFGGVFASFAGLTLLFIIIGAISSMSPQLLGTLLAFWAVIFLTGYIGGLAATVFLFISLIYFIANLINFIQKIRS